MIGHILVVMILKSHHIRHKSVCRDLKCLKQVSFLLQRERILLQLWTILCWKSKSKERLEEELTWKMAYIMQVRGRLLEYSETVKIFKPHLFRSSNSWKEKTQANEINRNFQSDKLKSTKVLVNLPPTFDSKSSLSVLTPKRAMPQLRLGPWDTFFTPLI